MTVGQIAYIAALFLVLALSKPGRVTVGAMLCNLAATLIVAGSMDMGLVTTQGSLISYMLVDLATAAAVAFNAPVLAVLLGTAIPIYALGLIAELPRGTTLGITQGLALVQLVAISGGYGGGGGLRDHIRRLGFRWRSAGGSPSGVVVSQGSEE